MKRGRRWWILSGLIMAGLALVAASPEAFAQSEEGANELPLNGPDCRYSRRVATTVDTAEGFEHIGFPRDDVFRPLLAAPLEPRFSGTFGWAVFDPDLSRSNGFSHFIAAFVGLAGSAGFWSWRNWQTCDGIQINMFGGAFSQFALNPLYLLNVDYHGGLSATGSWGTFSARLRIYHQSSHLGDDFLLENPDFSAQNLSFEAADLVGSLFGSWWRIYAGGGWLLRVDPADLGRASFQLGAELRSEVWERPAPLPTMLWAPVMGTDLVSHQARNWGVTWNTKAGVELVGQQYRRRFRLVATYLFGFSPYGYFFREHQVSSPGLEVHFVY